MRDPNPFRDDLAAAGVALLSCAWLAVVAVLLLLTACGGPDKAAGPSAAEMAVKGS